MMTIMQLDDFLKKINNQELIQFAETMAVIDQHYYYQPTKFSNGCGDDQLVNQPGTNEGSCKIFAFAKLHQLTEEQTLQLFGDYYRVDVLQHPEADSHRNIRSFMRFGWAGIQFAGIALTAK